MRVRRRSRSSRLRNSVEALPHHTKEAMLQGIDSNRIIVGAYADRRGGVCPMLAAHRNGGRTDYATFARAWDEYTGAGRKARRASRREVLTLRSYLERSLASEGWTGHASPENGSSLAAEVRAVQAARRRLAESDARSGTEVTIEELLAEAEIADALRPGVVPADGSWERERDKALATIAGPPSISSPDASLTSAP